MQNIELIYEGIKPKKVNIRDINNGMVILRVQEERFNSKSLQDLAGYFKFLLNYRFVKCKIIIHLKKCNFQDKLTYLILEAMIYHMFCNSNFEIYLGVKDNNVYNKIHNNSFWSSALYRTVEENGKIPKSEFIKEYTKKIFTDEFVYRRYLSREELQKSKTPSKILTDISIIIGSQKGYEDLAEDVAVIISELACNVRSHTTSDCLVDIDFCQLKDGGKGINIAFINFSPETVFDKIEELIKEEQYVADDPIYKDVYKAYDNHKQFFNPEYTEEHFFLVTAFQNHVTTRRKLSGSNGTGLATLIEKIIGKADRDYSYILSGDSMLYFKQEFLKLPDKFIGFNEQNNYIDYRPSKEVIGKSALNIPGTVYQLLLIKEGS